MICRSTLCWPMQFSGAELPVTVMMLLKVGDTIIELLNEPVLQVKEFAPFAVKLVLCKAQTLVLPLIWMFGRLMLCTRIVFVLVHASKLCEPVTENTVFKVGLTLIELELEPLFQV